MGENNVKKFFIDGAGQKPDGSGGGFCWVRQGTGTQRIKWQDQLTNNQAEYSALIAVVKYVRPGSHLEVSSDSMLVVQQFNGAWAVNDPELAKLLSEVRDVIDDKDLKVELRWVPRLRNLAGKLLEKRQKMQAEHTVKGVPS